MSRKRYNPHKKFMAFNAVLFFAVLFITALFLYLAYTMKRDADKIVVEIDHAEGVWIDDCVELSRFIESKLDREEEDYELEVGSAGIGQPFKVLKQYLIHIGKEVEVLTKDGKKLEGVLKDANEENMTVTIQKKVKPEGAKRPKLVEEDVTYTYNDIKHTKYLISFK